jgi:poly(A) polymerase
METFTRLLETPPLPQALLPLPGAAEAFLVGGALRNARLGLPVTDFDFATPFDPSSLARAFAARCGGRWFVLDAWRNQSRVVWTSPAGTLLSFDFAPFRAADLAGDLRGRDFTVNTLALALGSRQLFDPLGGAADLAARLLRDCAAGTFTEDPLRILRAVRLAVTLGFAIEAGTWERAGQNAELLHGVPAERRADEVVRIVNHPRAAAGLELLARLGVVSQLFGPRPASASRWLEQAAAGLARLTEFAAWLPDRHPQLAALLIAPVGRSLLRLGRLRLACIIAPGSFDPAAVEERLALGRETLMALEHLLPVVSGSHPPPPTRPTRRSQARWAAQEAFTEDRLLLAAALAPDAAAREAQLEALAAFLDLQQEGRIPDLVDGRWITRNLGVAPGPELGELLAALREAELSGTVQNPDEARKFLILLREKTVDKKNGKAL